jgi:hypothetical protein
MPIVAFWEPAPIGFVKFQLHFTDILTPNPDLSASSYTGVGAFLANRKSLIFRDLSTFEAKIDGEIQMGFFPEPDDPFIAYDGTTADLFGADGKPIAPFSVELLPL